MLACDLHRQRGLRALRARPPTSTLTDAVKPDVAEVITNSKRGARRAGNELTAGTLGKCAARAIKRNLAPCSKSRLVHLVLAAVCSLASRLPSQQCARSKAPM